MSEPLACPTCALRYDLDERFCAKCGMPLVYVGSDPVELPVDDAHGRARKIDPRYTEGELVRVAGGRNQAEAEFIQGMLLEEGVPSILRRSAGFDVPDFLAAGPRDVLVPQAGAGVARGGAARGGDGSAGGGLRLRGQGRARLAAFVRRGGALAALVAWLLLQSALRLGEFPGSCACEPLYRAAAEAAGAELVQGDDFEGLFDGSLDGAFICGLPYVRLARRAGSRRSTAARSLAGGRGTAGKRSTSPT